MVSNCKQPDQNEVTTEVPTEQSDEVLEDEQSHAQEVATERFLKKCEAIKGRLTICR